MGIYQSWKTDGKKESEGVEVQFEANEDGTIPTFTICRMGDSNKEFAKMLDQLTKPYRRQMQLGTLPKSKDAEIFMEVFVCTVLRGWSNVQDENNNIIPFNKENAIKVFTDLPEIYKELQANSSNLALFRVDALEAEAKN